MMNTHSIYELNAEMTEDLSGATLEWTSRGKTGMDNGKKMIPHLGTTLYDYLEKAAHTISLALHRHIKMK